MREESGKGPLVVLVGPTAVGKTAVAIELALALNGEVVTADSMQVYKGMDIGTAKPTPRETKGVPHHLIDVVTPDTPFNVALYRDMAHRVIAEVHARGRVPIVSGGTGLYIRAVLDEFLFPDQGADPALRCRLQEMAAEHGPEHLYAMLVRVDPERAAELHPNDVRRVIRALEVYEVTGRPMSEHIREAKAKSPRYRDVRIGLIRPRSELYERINRRVDEQLRRGLVEEVKTLRSRYPLQDTALQALGYKEIIAFLDGECSLDEAVRRLKRETRRYAKRQLTWFRRDESITWFDLSRYPSLDAATDAIRSHVVKVLPELARP